MIHKDCKKRIETEKNDSRSWKGDDLDITCTLNYYLIKVERIPSENTEKNECACSSVCLKRVLGKSGCPRQSVGDQIIRDISGLIIW